MFIEFTTTITHKIEFNDGGIKSITHSAAVDANEASALGDHALTRIAEAGVKATLRAFENNRVAREWNDDDEGESE